MPPEQKYRLGDVLVDQGLISLGQLSKALELQKTDNQRIGKTLVQMKVVAERDVISALSHQAVFNRKHAASNASNNSSHSNKRSKKSRIFKRTVLVLVALTLAAVVIIVLNENNKEQTLTNQTVLNTANVAAQQDSTEKANSDTITGATATIQAIEIYESALQQQFIFHASTPLKNNVERKYGPENRVSYLFADTALANTDTVINADDSWIRNVRLKQTPEGLLWTFQLTDAGSAKYHEIGPTIDNTNYQFVVVIRKSYE